MWVRVFFEVPESGWSVGHDDVQRANDECTGSAGERQNYAACERC